MMIFYFTIYDQLNRNASENVWVCFNVYIFMDIIFLNKGFDNIVKVKNERHGVLKANHYVNVIVFISIF